MNNKMIKENKMGVMPVNKLLVTMSLPMIVSMLVQALYNVVDSVFVSMVSENQLTAVSLAFPIQTLMIAFGTGTGVGVSALLSRSLGEKDYEHANKTAKNGVFLAVLTYLLFLFVGILASSAFYHSQTNDPEILAAGISYITICCTFSFGLFTQLIMEKLLQSTGKTIYSMVIQGVGAVINLIFDPILIFGLCGVPAMGAKGAAIATVAGQIIAGVLAIVLNVKKNHELSINMKGFRPDKGMIGKIYAIGIPSIIMQAIGSIMTYGMNLILISFSSTATAVFGVYYKLQSFIFMPIFGLNNGMVPIIAYNYGAGKRKRMVKTIKLSMMYAVTIMAIGFAVFQLIPEKLLELFSASETMLEIGVPALRTISYSFIFAGYCIVAGSVFQALGNAVYSLIVSVARQMIVLLPAAYILSKIGGLADVWYSFPLAEIASVVMSTLFMVLVYKKVIKNVPIED